MFKKTVKVLFKIYDVFAHIVGHIFLLAVIIGTIYYKVFITKLNGDLEYVLIELVIILSLILLIIFIIYKLKKRFSKGNK